MKGAGTCTDFECVVNPPGSVVVEWPGLAGGHRPLLGVVSFSGKKADVKLSDEKLGSQGDRLNTPESEQVLHSRISARSEASVPLERAPVAPCYPVPMPLRLSLWLSPPRHSVLAPAASWLLVPHRPSPNTHMGLTPAWSLACPPRPPIPLCSLCPNLPFPATPPDHWRPPPASTHSPPPLPGSGISTQHSLYYMPFLHLTHSFL